MPGGQKGTKQAMLFGTISKFREAAGKQMMTDPKVQEAVYQQTVKGRAAVAAKQGGERLGAGPGGESTGQDDGAGAAVRRIGRAFGAGLEGVLAQE